MRSALRLTLTALLALALPLAAQQPTQPTIDKVDPPNWFAALPSPTLLIHGTGLAGATFTGAPTTHTVTSPNGHWAIVQLDTHTIAAGTLHLIAHTSAGDASFDYKLSPRRTDGISGFSPADVMTCIMPDRFANGDPTNDNLPGMPPADRSAPRAYHGGDLKGVIDHLDYLQQLGITAVWLTPIVANNPAGRDYHGYGAADLYAVDSHLGTLADYQRLAAELHRRHMKLLFDDVPNHFGPAHPWALDPPLPAVFHGTPADHKEAAYDFNRILDPHLPESAANLELNGWFANTLPDLNQQNPFVAQYLLQNMIWWIEETGLDALRIDTFPYVQRTFWQGYLSALQNIYPRLNFVGEVDNGDSNVNAYFAGGRKIAGIDTHLTTPFDYPYFFALRNVLLKGKPFDDLETTFRQDWLYPHPELLVPILDNHDNARFMSEPGATPELMRIATGITLTVRGTPQLYIGDEILMQGGEDPDNRRDFPGGFPGDPVNAFTPAGRNPDQARLHDFTAALGQLRAQSPALQGGAQQAVLVDKDTFAYVRVPAGASSACPVQQSGASSTRTSGASSTRTSSAAQPLLIAVNRAATPATLNIPHQANMLEGCSRLVPVLGDVSPASSLTITLPPFGFAIYRPE